MKRISACILVLVLCLSNVLPTFATELDTVQVSTVSITETQHGKIMIQNEDTFQKEILPEQKVILQPISENGFELIKLEVKSESGKNIPLEQKQENNYEFVMPAENCIVKAEFKEISQEDSPETTLPDESEATVPSTPEVSEPDASEIIIPDVPAVTESNTAEVTEPDVSEITESDSPNLLSNTDGKAIVTRSTARGVGIEYWGKVTYRGTTVGAFTINGNIAFCMEHLKPTPDTGTGFAESIYENENIRRVLYYGWSGKGQWSGFGSYEQGAVVTSLALSYFYSGSDTMGMLPHGSSAKAIGLSDFLYFIEANPVPDAKTFNFSKSNVNSFLTNDKTKQQTENITLNADPMNSITIPLTDGMSLVNVSTGATNTGSAVINGGQTFYLTAPLNMNASWSTGNLTGSMGKFNAVLAMTDSPGLQNLGYGLWATDPDKIVNLTVKWEALGQIKVNKTDEETGAKIQGAEFTIYAEQDFFAPDGSTIYLKGQKVETIITGADGVALSKPTYLGKYRVVETKQAPGHLFEEKEFSVELKFGDTTVGMATAELNVTNKSTQIELNKSDIETGKPLQGVTFALQTTSKDDVDPGYDNEKKFYETDAEGNLAIKDIVPGEYVLAEYQQLPGYVRDDTQYYISVNEKGEISIDKQEKDTINNSESEVNKEQNKLTFNIKNTSNRLIINKTDAETGTPMQSVKFALQTISKDDIDPSFNNEKTFYETDSEGNITISNIVPGDYVLGEFLQASGYVRDDTLYHILVNEKGEISLDKKEKDAINNSSETQSDNKEQLTLNIKNTYNRLILNKTDLAGKKPLPGVTFEFWRAEAEEPDALDPGFSTREQLVTDESGNITVEKIAEGTYHLQEKETLAGYVLDETLYTIVVDDKGTFSIEKEESKEHSGTETISNNKDVLTINFQNDITKIQLSKQDTTTGKELPGAKLKVTDSTGKEIDSWTSQNEPHLIQNLLVGETYTLHEEIAPRGYLIAQDVQFTIENTGEVQKVVMKDQYSVGKIGTHIDKNSQGGMRSSAAGKTGDNANMVAYAALFVMGACIIMCRLVRRKDEQEK